MLSISASEIILVYILICITKGIVANIPYHKSLPPPSIRNDIKLPEEKWFQQKLDHFNPSNGRTWQQRYFINSSFYEPNGPLFIMIGGEGPASAKWMVTGAWVDYAQESKALMLQVEHRFYGKSHPTSDMSVENLEFLSSEQALADLAYFVTTMKSQYNMTDHNKVISFGGSYPGSLAVWFRLKYPHVVHASVSSSAPLVAKVNFKEYLEVVHDSLMAKGNIQCLKGISKATKYINILLQHRVGWQNLQENFRLCEPLDGSNANDVSNLFEILAENVEDVVQYNEDNREFEGAKGTNITIDVICDMMGNESLGNAYKRYVKLNSLILDTYEKDCLNHTYKSMIQNLRNVTWPSGPAGAGRQWIYQTCTEFGFYQSSDSPRQPFGSYFPPQFFTRQCADIFGPKFTKRLLEKGIERTNIMYGGKNPKVSRVVLVNGSIDPWHSLGVTKSLNKKVPAIYIKGTAHCANMYPPSPSDSEDLKHARKTIGTLIKQWLKEE